MAEKKDGSTLELIEPCWMCATHSWGCGGYTKECDDRCAYANLVKRHEAMRQGIANMIEKMKAQRIELERRIEDLRIEDGDSDQ